jgi:hypothetical protein
MVAAGRQLRAQTPPLAAEHISSLLGMGEIGQIRRLVEKLDPRPADTLLAS